MKDTTSFWTWFETLKPQLFRRADSFEKMFRYLDTLPGPITIVETGCMRRDPTEDKSWTGDGCSTMLFDRYVQERGGIVYSVDINTEHTEACRKLVSDHVLVNTGDSIDFLKSFAIAMEGETILPLSLVYLDSFDSMSIEPFETALHCAKEFEAIKPALTDQTLVVIDDTPSEFVKGITEPSLEITGKGRFVYTYAQHVGAETLFSGWQIGWTHMVGVRWESGYDKAKFGRVGKFTDPDRDLQELVERARAHVEAGHTQAAADAYRAVIVVTKAPQSGMQRVARGEACAFYARTAVAAGSHGMAFDWYKDALLADPRCVEYRIEMASKVHMKMMHFRLARQEAICSTLLEPDNPAAWRALGEAEHGLCNAGASRDAFERQLQLAPDDPVAMLDVCVIALDQADYKRCRKLVAELINVNQQAEATHVLAMVMNREGNHEKAADLFQEAIDLKCGNHLVAHWNRSLSLLALGRYREGWTEQEFRRFDKNPSLSISFMRFTRPLYEGQPSTILEGAERRRAILLIHAEAGMGDNFAFVRFLPEFVKRGFEVRYEAHPEMAALIQRSYPDVEVVPRALDFPGAVGLKPFDYHLPLGSMAHVLGTDIDTVPTFPSYLRPDQELVRKYSQALDHVGNGRAIVGVCWSSGIREYGIWIAEYGRRKSMTFETIAPLIQAIDEAGSPVINLQVGPERSQHGGVIVDVLPDKPNWDDTAALIANLDLVVTVDTAVAHLAGALDVPTYLMMQQDGASWHFMAARPGAPWNEASPWYPSIRIFRQESPGDWDGVVQRVAAELAKLRF